MSLLIFTANFPPNPGGIARFLDEFCHHLPAPVRVVTTVPEDAGEDTETSRHARDYEVTRIDAGDGSGVAGKLKMWAGLTSGLMHYRPTVGLVGHGHLTFSGLPFTLWQHAGNRYGIIAYALEIKHMQNARGLKSALNSFVYRNADFVVAISKFTKELLVQAGVAEDKIHVIHPGVSPHFLQAPPARDRVREEMGLGDDFVVGTVSRLVTRKGHELVLRALATLDEPSGWQYLIVGDGPRRERLEALSEALGIADRVMFLGHTADEQLPGLYDAMDLFVLPTQPTDDPFDVEGFGIVFLEAAARGTPAVGSPIGGVTDAVADGQSGLLVPPTPEDIAEAVEQFRSDHALRERMSAQARRRVEQEFTWASMADKFCRIAGL